MIFVYLIDDKR